MPSRGGRTRLRSVMLPLDPGVLGRPRVNAGWRTQEEKTLFLSFLSMPHSMKICKSQPVVFFGYFVDPAPQPIVVLGAPKTRKQIFRMFSISEQTAKISGAARIQRMRKERAEKERGVDSALWGCIEGVSVSSSSGLQEID